MELVCLSVINGWQTGIKHTDIKFGPSFNNLNDLFKWQKNNIYSPIKEATEPRLLDDLFMQYERELMEKYLKLDSKALLTMA
jgi:hypothetical protein